MERFFEITEDLDAPGAFAVGGDASLPQPLLRVRASTMRRVAAPTFQAQQLLKVAERAAHGRDEATGRHRRVAHQGRPAVI